MRRIFAASLVIVMAAATSVFAADDQTIAPAVSTAVTAAAPGEDTVDFSRLESNRRPMVLPALYGATAFLQGYDAYSTLTVLNRGGVEANPFMKSMTKSPVAFVALKAGIASLSIVAAERMWKSNNRVGAVATMLVTNGFMSWVAIHNAGVMKQLK